MENNCDAEIGGVGLFQQVAPCMTPCALPRRRKKVSVCSNFSTFSNSSEQPYISMMSNASRERKISTLSTGSLATGRYSSEESVRARKTSEGIPSSLPQSCQTELSQAVACEDIRALLAELQYFDLKSNIWLFI